MTISRSNMSQQLKGNPMKKPVKKADESKMSNKDRFLAMIEKKKKKPAKKKAK